MELEQREERIQGHETLKLEYSRKAGSATVHGYEKRSDFVTGNSRIHLQWASRKPDLREESHLKGALT